VEALWRAVEEPAPPGLDGPDEGDPRQIVWDAAGGLGGLAVSMPVAALVATVVACPGVVGELTPELLLYGLGLAMLLPVVPFALELLALRRLTTGAFGTLMALEPAFALVIGFLVLGQVPNGIAGIAIDRGRGLSNSARHQSHRRRRSRRP